jgi:hypothetical protein
MKFTKAIVRDIVQAARCAVCATPAGRAMRLQGVEMICANCDRDATFA